MIDVAVMAGPDWPRNIDWEGLASQAVSAAVRASVFSILVETSAAVEVSVKLAEDDEVRTLNRQYRGKDKPTNVLSFPMVQPDLIEGLGNTDDGEVLLGDIILARGVCVAEAAEKHVDLGTHVTHLIVHGTLHLLGHDHHDDIDGDRMESIERVALATLGIADPYAVDES